MCRFVEQLSSGDDLVMDFFAGSCSMAHAVMKQNRRDGGHRRYVCVQLPELIKADTETSRRGYKTISQLGLHRIRKAAKMLADDEDTMLIRSNGDSANLAVRVFRLSESNIRRWHGVETKDADIYVEQLDAFADTLMPGWKPEDVIWEVALREGYVLTANIEKRDVDGQIVWRVSDPEREQCCHICLDDTLDVETVRTLGLTRDDLLVCRDNALDDTLAANLALQCRLKVL